MHHEQSGSDMKKIPKWTVVVVAAGLGSLGAFVAVQAGRARVKNALRRAEEIADRSRAALEATESALHDAQAFL
jgi:hypothetical protein